MPDPIDATPHAFDPDTPTEAVGTLRLIDLDALGLPRPGWLFVAAAAIVAAIRLGAVDGWTLDAIPSLLFTIEVVSIILLPAALLRRAPLAVRSHRLLLWGLAGVALVEVVRTLIAYLPAGNAIAPAAWTISSGPILLAFRVAATILVGLGLTRLLPGVPGRRWLLVTIGAAYLALTYVPLWIAASWAAVVADPSSLALAVASLLASAFATWVAVTAWLDRAAARTFWALLAAALPITLAIQLLAAAGLLDLVRPGPGGAFPSLAVTALGEATIACLALVAYLGYTPIPDADQDPGRSIAAPLSRISQTLTEAATRADRDAGE